MKNPSPSKSSAPAEIPATEGLIVTGEQPGREGVMPPAAPSRPSRPVQEPTVPAQPPGGDGMAFLGTFTMPGMVGRVNDGRCAALPLVVAKASGAIVGVVVLSDPGLAGSALAKRLSDAGYGGSFKFLGTGEIDAATRLAAARAIAAEKQDPCLDKMGAVMALGFNTLAL